MPSNSIKPLVFISYAHLDEPDPPEQPAEGRIRWLSFVMGFLRPGVKGRRYEVWNDRQMTGGADRDPEIEAKLRACDIFILLVSAHSTASDYIVDKEIAIIRERQARHEPVHFYPLLLTPTPKQQIAKGQRQEFAPARRQAVLGILPPATTACSTCRTRPTKSPTWPNGIVQQKTAAQPSVPAAPARLCPHHRPARNRLRAAGRPRRRTRAPRRGLGRSHRQHSLAGGGRRCRQVGAGQRMAASDASRRLSRRRSRARLVVLQPGRQGARDLGRAVPQLGAR